MYSNTIFEKLVRKEWLCFVMAMAAFGIQHVIYAGGKPMLGPPWVPVQPLMAYLTGVAMIVAAAGIATKKSAPVASILLGTVLFLRVLIVYVPGLVANIHDPSNWTSGFELLAICGASWMLAATLRMERPFYPKMEDVFGRVGKFGRFLFALALAVFGIQHFLYARFVATLVPSWIPGHLFWVYFVGVAFLTAALSIIFGRSAHLAANLLAVMFFLWVIVVHLPRVVAAASNGNEWTSAFVALAMSGSALIVASSFKPALSEHLTRPNEQIPLQAKNLRPADPL